LLITNQYTKEVGFKDQPSSIQISGVRSGSKKKSKIQDRALLMKIEGHRVVDKKYNRRRHQP
jgi:hypothetical protein